MPDIDSKLLVTWRVKGAPPTQPICCSVGALMGFSFPAYAGHMLFCLKFACFGFAMPVFCGLSWLPLVPRRHPLTTLVGAPLWPQSAPLDPTEEQVDEFHQLYCQALRELFDTHKASYGMAHASLDLV
eukprot:s16_g40.t1